MFVDALDQDHGGKANLAEFTGLLDKMREQLGLKDGAAKEYTSFNKMAGDRYKHVRMANNLEEKYKVPMTFNQSIGFKVEDERNKDLIKMDRHPIVLCAETKYADEMIKTRFPMWEYAPDFRKNRLNFIYMRNT